MLVPHRLYGRECDIATLRAAFEDVATTGAPVWVSVSGYSGVGKSALVNELRAPKLEERGHFIAGKFDQYKRDVPDESLAQAFRGLFRRILGESDTGIVRWREALCEALGPNGQLMVTLIPELELCLRRPNFDHPYRLNIDQGWKPASCVAGCG